jgi:hypothetical protein
LKKLPLSLAIIILAALTAYAQKDASHDFRNTRWGMSPAQVKLTENGKPVSETELPPYELAITYKGKYEGLDAEIGYMFSKDKLVLGGYAVTNKYEDPAQYIRDYQKLKGVLSTEYGAPARDDKVWSPGEKEGETTAEAYGKAVTEGKLVMQTAWTAPETQVFLTLEGGNVNTILSVLYYSSKLNPRIGEQRLKQELEKF